MVLGMNIAKYVYDEVHGYIPLTEAELRIIDTPTFQRLRRVKQLAQAWFVYPGAVHTRFSHSLGAMHLMGLIISKFVDEGLIPSDDVELLRIAALLHDIGHTPFSHAIESFFRRHYGVSHEDISSWIVMEDPHIADALRDYGLEPREVAAIINGTHKEVTYNMLLSSDLDVDRLDYLLRDALHTGVRYGLIDIHRITATMSIDDEGYLSIPAKAVQAVESFYIARLHMYRSVYYHKTITAYQLLIESIYEEMIKDSEVRSMLEPFTSAEGIRKAIKSGKIYVWDDFLVGGLMNYLVTRGVGGDVLRNLVRLYLERNGYRVVYDLTGFTRGSAEGVLENVLNSLTNSLERERLSEHDVKIYSDVVPIVTEDACIRIRSGGNSIPITRFHSSIINELPSIMYVVRVYSLPEKYEFIRRLVRCGPP